VAGGTVVLCGNPRPGSRTLRVAQAAAAALAAASRAAPGAAEPVVLDLAALPAPFGPNAGTHLAEPLALVRGAELLVVASPTYKATYTGLLKAFFDLLPGPALAGVAAVPVMTAGGPRHALAADVHLRPLLLELGAHTPTAALVVLEEELPRLEDVVGAWAATAAPLLGRDPLVRGDPVPAGEPG
jgi:FMN reductase